MEDQELLYPETSKAKKISDLTIERDAARETCSKLQQENDRLTALTRRLEDDLIASRYNESIARETRDEAVVKIFHVMKACEPCEPEQTTGKECGRTVCVLARQVREILTLCPRCKKHHPLGDACATS